MIKNILQITPLAVRRKQIVWVCFFTLLFLLSINGITEPYRNAMLSLSVYGNISQIFVKEGDKIPKGATILELDNSLEVLEEKRSKLILDSKAEVNSAAAQIRTLDSHLTATKDLYKSTGSISKEELEKQELEYTRAVAEHERLKNSEKRERIEHQIAIEILRKRILQAPFKGYISEVFIEIGEHGKPDEPLVQLVDTSRCFFISNIEEQTGRTLSLGQTVELQLQAGSESVTKKGTITFISPVVDPASGLRKVKTLFDNHDGKIVPGVAGVMVLDQKEQTHTLQQKSVSTAHPAAINN